MNHGMRVAFRPWRCECFRGCLTGSLTCMLFCCFRRFNLVPKRMLYFICIYAVNHAANRAGLYVLHVCHHCVAAVELGGMLDMSMRCLSLTTTNLSGLCRF